MTEAKPRRTKKIQGGPRSQAVVEKVHAATLAEIDRAGFVGMTMDGVARAAGINRTTLYRRWPSKADLVADLFEQEVSRLETATLPVDPQAAVADMLDRLVDNLSRREGRALARVVMAGDPLLAPLSLAARQRALAALRAPLARLGPGDVDVVAHALFYGVTHWVDLHGGVMPAGDRDRFVRLALAGMRGG